jgi:hypothetical protein
MIPWFPLHREVRMISKPECATVALSCCYYHCPCHSISSHYGGGDLRICCWKNQKERILRLVGWGGGASFPCRKQKMLWKVTKSYSKPEQKRLNGEPKHRREYQGTGCERLGWIEMAQDKANWGGSSCEHGDEPSSSSWASLPASWVA